jgi:hypothetical protein
MFRRVVVRLLTPLLLLPGIAHSHAGASAHDPSGLDRSPHFHLRMFYPLWHQVSNDQNRDFRHAGDEGETLSKGGSRVNHDDDAVYVPVYFLFGWYLESQVGQIDPSALVTLVGMDRLPCTARVSISSQELFLSAFSWSRCPIYLSSLTLLI